MTTLITKSPGKLFKFSLHTAFGTVLVIGPGEIMPTVFMVYMIWALLQLWIVTG